MTEDLLQDSTTKHRDKKFQELIVKKRDKSEKFESVRLRPRVMILALLRNNQTSMNNALATNLN